MNVAALLRKCPTKIPGGGRAFAKWLGTTVKKLEAAGMEELDELFSPHLRPLGGLRRLDQIGFRWLVVAEWKTYTGVDVKRMTFTGYGESYLEAAVSALVGAYELDWLRRNSGKTP